ncbi:sulfatase-like hydrolase/transferase [Selenomonas massiliensis]|uniref:sulfatase-like hydrolase/transferase n=1 Tax=Selenomonas massiliensis TaxID=2058293 RepID=UPI000D0F80CB|nr:sulfatase-like hydrolase/transferase [Selenomonas massiliensis]
MQDDFTVFWRNNERAYDLFQDLLARAAKNAYDDDFLAQLAVYRAESPTSENADIFAAQYLLHHGDVENAVSCGERAYAKRPVNHALWKVLAAAYAMCGRTLDAAVLQGYLYRHDPAHAHLSLHLTEENMRAALARFSVAINTGNCAPLLPTRAIIDEEGLHFAPDLLLGEPLPIDTPDGIPFWSAVYVENEVLSERSIFLDALRTDPHLLAYRCQDFVFDLQKAHECRATSAIEVTEGGAVYVPVAGTEEGQKLFVSVSGSERPAVLGKWAFSYFRFDESVTLRAEDDSPYIVGTPIRVGHAPHRRKLVLNILVDGLSWPAVRECFAARMPETAQFFARGTVFDQHFSTSEYTYPALPAIETGRCPHHTQVFNEQNSHPLLPAHRTLSECMKDLGYYCTAVMASGDGIYSGALRGHDRILTHTGNLPCHEGVERTIRHLEAFDEADQFLFLHCADVHPWNGVGYKFAPEVETHLPPEERLFPLEKNGLSVRLPHYPIYQRQFFANLCHVDRSLGQLFAYITQRYTEDEYIVNLYSDHGSSIFAPPPPDGRVDVISENSTGAAWMMRGAGVPEGVRVQDLTSSVDIFPTLAHLCGFPVTGDIDGRLPAVFGGTPRDCVCSASQFPGQTFKLAVRTHDYALRMETQGFTETDGTANFAGAMAEIYPRGHEFDPACAVDSAELRRFFYPRARDFVREIANNGEVFA